MSADTCVYCPDPAEYVCAACDRPICWDDSATGQYERFCAVGAAVRRQYAVMSRPPAPVTTPKGVAPSDARRVRVAGVCLARWVHKCVGCAATLKSGTLPHGGGDEVHEVGLCDRCRDTRTLFRWRCCQCGTRDYRPPEIHPRTSGYGPVEWSDGLCVDCLEDTDGP